MLLHIAREVDPSIKGVFFDTGIESRGVREFVKTFDNVEIIKPNHTFYEIISRYGYPIVSKEVACAIMESRRYIDNHRIELEERFGGAGKYTDLVAFAGEGHNRSAQLAGIATIERDGKVTKSPYNKNKWGYLLDAPFLISYMCCNYLKKDPSHAYEKQHNVKFMIATMCSESRLRESNWLKFGCNAFEMTNPKSTPMAFWTEQDVLAYIYKYSIPIARDYGSVIKEGDSEEYSQLELFDIDAPVFKTTGASRTGCYTCGFGAHLDKQPTRLERLGPKYRDIVLQGGKFVDELWKPHRGFGFAFVYEYMIAHGAKIIIPEREKYYNALPDKAKEILRMEEQKCSSLAKSKT